MLALLRRLFDRIWPVAICRSCGDAPPVKGTALCSDCTPSKERRP